MNGLSSYLNGSEFVPQLEHSVPHAYSLLTLPTHPSIHLPYRHEIHKFKTGKSLSLYAPHIGLVRPHRPSLSNPKSSIALAHFTSSASDHAVPMSARPKGMLVVLFVEAGRVTTG